MGIDVAKATVITSADCIGCLECVEACPRAGALELHLGLPVGCPGMSTETTTMDTTDHGAQGGLAGFPGRLRPPRHRDLRGRHRHRHGDRHVPDLRAADGRRRARRAPGRDRHRDQGLDGHRRGREAWSVPLPQMLAALTCPPTPPPDGDQGSREQRFSVTALRDWLEAGGGSTP